MAPRKQLPFSDKHASSEDYVEALLRFLTTSDLLQMLCGGIHILDFLTLEPDLFETVLPMEWRLWLREFSILDILDFLMREDLASLHRLPDTCGSFEDFENRHNNSRAWRGGPLPPSSLLQYVQNVRDLTLVRDFRGSDSTAASTQRLSRQIAVGMKPKKVHEVQSFAAFIDVLTSEIATTRAHDVSHLVDFGSGQNYLGRVLASPKYRKHVIAVESKEANISGAMAMDVRAKVARKTLVFRNKKKFRIGVGVHQKEKGIGGSRQVEDRLDLVNLDASVKPPSPAKQVELLYESTSPEKSGGIQYVEHVIGNGDLSSVINQIESRKYGKKGVSTPTLNENPELQSLESLDRREIEVPNLMVISLHSCGNLVHHGLRSLVLNPCVCAVAMVGCCYNLMTERLGPPSFKLPNLRQQNDRLESTSSTCDPNGFPMSERLASYKHKHGKGIRLNITARMMAVQAPQNWTESDCDAFFTRHFYRALLQRIFLDRGVVESPVVIRPSAKENSSYTSAGTGQAIIIGSLRKACYSSFVAYVRGAVDKLRHDPERGASISERMQYLSDEDIRSYEKQYGDRKKDLSIIWSLMAFSAGIVESTIVVDRWLFLKEQKGIESAWVQTVFDYKQSPRNFVVVGIKR